MQDHLLRNCLPLIYLSLNIWQSCLPWSCGPVLFLFFIFHSQVNDNVTDTFNVKCCFCCLCHPCQFSGQQCNLVHGEVQNSLKHWIMLDVVQYCVEKGDFWNFMARFTFYRQLLVRQKAQLLDQLFGSVLPKTHIFVSLWINKKNMPKYKILKAF